MPALVSHFMFADSALHEAQPYLTKAIEAAPLAFRWGAQGPDILFFYHPLTENNVNRIGHRVHEERVGSMFQALTAACSRSHTPEATAYLLGYCCHYILDRSAHPFVTYIANYRIDPLYPQLSPSAQHNLCESELDRALIAAAHSGNPADYPAHMILSYDNKTANRIGTILSQAIWNVYGTRVSVSAVKSSMRSMIHVQHLLHDRFGRRHTALSWLEHRLHISGDFSSLIRPMTPIDADCTNHSHQPWIDASMPHMRHYTDYFQILNNSQRPAACLMEACYDAIQTGKPLPKHLFELNYMGMPE